MLSVKLKSQDKKPTTTKRSVRYQPRTIALWDKIQQRLKASSVIECDLDKDLDVATYRCLKSIDKAIDKLEAIGETSPPIIENQSTPSPTPPTPPANFASRLLNTD